MGVRKRKVKGGFSYFVEWSDGKGNRFSETIGSDYKLAKQVLAQRQVKVAEGKISEVCPHKKSLFESATKSYLDWRRVNTKSSNRAEELVNNLSTHFKGFDLAKITPKLIEKYKADRIQKVAPATVNRELSCLRAVFTKAIKWGDFEGENPISNKKVEFFKEENTRVRWITKEEIRELLKQCSTNKNLFNVVITALNTGMRKSEIFNLRWTDVDFKNRLIRVDYGKNHRQRFIPIPPQLEDVLRDIRAEEKTLDCSFVFNHNGEKYTFISRAFGNALKRTGIKDFRFHDLRHTYASHLAMQGVTLNTIRELLGHASMTTTLRYAHLSNESKKQAVSLLQIAYPKIVRDNESKINAEKTQSGLKSVELVKIGSNRQ